MRSYLDFEKSVAELETKVEELRAWKALVPESETLLWMHGNEAELRKDLAAHRTAKYAGIRPPEPAAATSATP